MAIQGNIVNKSLIYSDNDRARKAEADLASAIQNETAERIAGDQQSLGQFVTSIVINQSATSDEVDLNLYNIEGSLLSTLNFTVKNRQEIVSATYSKTAKSLILTNKAGTQIICDLSDMVDSLSNNITVEVARAKAAEEALSSRITSEVNRATKAEAQLSTDISTEQTARANADNTLQTNIDDESTKREKAVTTVTTLITKESETRRELIADLNEKIDTEVSDVREITEDIKDTIKNLTVGQSGGDGSYIKTVKQDSGLIAIGSQPFASEITDDATNAPNCKAVYDTFAKLDLDQVGQDGYFIKFISQEDGQVSAESYKFDTTITKLLATDKTAPTTKAVSDRFEALKGSYGVTDKTYLTNLTQDAGQVTATVELKVTALNETSPSNKLVTETAVATYVKGKLTDLTVEQVGTENTSYITSIKQDDGKITATSEDRVTEITTDSNNLVTEKAVKTYVDTETERATAGENYLMNQIKAETTRATTAENTLTSGLTTEGSVRKAADETLQTNIDTKVSKLVTSDTNDYLYLHEYDGTESGKVVSAQVVNSAVVARDSSGNIVVNTTPTSNDQAVSKYYADTQVTKIDTISVEGTTKEISDDKNVDLQLKDFGLIEESDPTVGIDSAKILKNVDTSIPLGVNFAINDKNGNDIVDSLDSKVDKETGKVLSSNDFTDDEKNKLSTVTAGAQPNVQSNWNVTDITDAAYIIAKPTSLKNPYGVYFGSAFYDGSKEVIVTSTDLDAESLANKDTNISSSSTNDKYPTSRAVYNFVGDSISSASGIFRGSYLTTDYPSEIRDPYNPDNEDILNLLNQIIENPANNDWVWMSVPASLLEPELIREDRRFRYTSLWNYEYTKTNSEAFDQGQWAAVNSTVTKEWKATIDEHVANKENPHNVTATQLGLGEVQNTGDSDTPIEGGLTKFTTGGAYTYLNGKVDKEEGKALVETEKVTMYDTHLINKSNPHGVTKAQVGLGDVENYPLDKAVTAGSSNYITSGAVKTYVDENDTALSNRVKTIEDDYLKAKDRNELQVNITSEETRAKEAEKELKEDIASEAKRANDAETTLTTNLNAEIERAKTAEEATNTNLSDEITRAKETEGNLNTKIETETTRAKAQEESISNLLSAETTRAKSAEELLTDNLATEITNRIDADTTLQNNIDKKVDKVTGKDLVETTKVEAYDAHINNTDIHVTQEDKANWNDKLCLSIVNGQLCMTYQKED